MGADIQEIDVPEDMKEQVEEYRAKLEAVVEYDEAVMNKFLAGEEVRLKKLKNLAARYYQ